MFRDWVKPGQTIGIIGGGQLGRMMTFSAKQMGYIVFIWDPTENCSAGQVADLHIQEPFEEGKTLDWFAEKCDVITYEFEHLPLSFMRKLAAKGNVPQGIALLEWTQHRLVEKRMIEDAGLHVAPYMPLENEEDLEEAMQLFGLPLVVKTVKGGYDGKGQVVVESESDMKEALSLIQTAACIGEAWMPFTKELSIMVHRNKRGETVMLPVVENHHRHQQLWLTEAPALVSKHVLQDIEEQAQRLVQHLQLVGTLAIELFLMEDGSIYVNELAPRPHNSGHYSIEACDWSQFDLHIQAICNRSLPQPVLHQEAFMVNIVGQDLARLEERMPSFVDWHVHLYGKGTPAPFRKMGHVTILSQERQKTLSEIRNSGIWPGNREELHT
ncbi:5-(carboxyamino)imidazole ribonucleotide synthase [Mangrovibacillus cuniculi]|uniref:N5-carboxyaminoimidazole ribonucleotide synthase n=1 Tax=Mangrovibacillus cuniculi TaxID=2593652 RepID=A0A7S8HE51_9BACI|nr:5-(carboxyamino)imidazole ribonucleotide synthase [Mangrovibacillus cuniculi]QPC45484.1 5-(carboxyamino)imidazole ribonucleotide synthase [Mangrovibacillus cuniculi]